MTVNRWKTEMKRRAEVSQHLGADGGNDGSIFVSLV